jgi:CRP-like cAMP-binding protein
LTRNVLIAALPGAARDRLARYTRLVELPRGEILHRAGAEVRYVYFPLDCLISVTLTTADGQTAEVGVVGQRGVTGLGAVLGVSGPAHTETVCQAPGSAARVEAGPLIDEFERNKGVRDVLLRYAQAYLAQLSQNVACSRFHSLEQRMARWLLDSRYRLRSDEMALTHDFVATMLGVRRASVTEMAAALQSRGLIEYGRGWVRVADPARLEAVSCECYHVVRDAYERLLNPLAAEG